MQFSITDIVLATWIKPTNTKSKALTASFGQYTLPENVHISGEYQETKDYIYKDRQAYAMYTFSKVRPCSHPMYGQLTNLRAATTKGGTGIEKS